MSSIPNIENASSDLYFDIGLNNFAFQSESIPDLQTDKNCELTKYLEEMYTHQYNFYF